MGIWIDAFILLVGLGQDPTSARDAAAINAAKQVVVQTIDPALPRVSFVEWLREVVGSASTTAWEVNDCGEQSGDPKQDQGRDFPMCVEAQVGLPGQRELHVSLAVGSFKKGVGGVPQFRAAYVKKASGSLESVKSLAEIPSAIRIGPASTRRLPGSNQNARGGFNLVSASVASTYPSGGSMTAQFLVVAIAACAVAQTPDRPIAGLWSAEFEGRTFIRLELETVNGAVTGGISLGNLEVDSQGVVKRADAAPPNLTPLFDVTLSGTTLTFFRKDGTDTDQFVLRVRDDASADLEFLLNDEDRQELAARGVPLPKPIRLRKAG